MTNTPEDTTAIIAEAMQAATCQQVFDYIRQATIGMNAVMEERNGEPTFLSEIVPGFATMGAILTGNLRQLANVIEMRGVLDLQANAAKNNLRSDIMDMLGAMILVLDNVAILVNPKLNLYDLIAAAFNGTCAQHEVDLRMATES
jgi:hypothetical protein